MRGLSVRKFWMLLLTGLIATGSLIGSQAGGQVALAAPPPITPSPTQPIKGERFTVSGALKTKVVRPVVLEQKVGKKWKRIASGKTNKAGRFSLTSSTTAASVTVRVVAKRAKVKGKKYPQIITKTRKVTTTAGQSAYLALPASAEVTEAVSAKMTFAPVRAGRPVQLEVRVGGSWKQVATGVESNQGTVVLHFTAVSQGTYTYRAVAPAWKGASGVASAPATLTISTETVRLAMPTKVLARDEAGTISSFDSATGIVEFSVLPDSLSGLAVGDALVIPPRVGAASGALRKVTDVRVGASGVTVATAPTTLREVIKNTPDSLSSIGLTVISSEFTPANGVSTQSLPKKPRLVPSSGLRPTSVDPLTLVVDISVDMPGLTTISLNGTYALNPGAELGFDADWSGLRRYKIVVWSDIDSSLSAAIGFAAKGAKTIKLGDLRQVHSGEIGPVPVWVEIDYKLIAEVTAAGSVVLKMETTQTGTARFGATDTGGGDLTPKPFAQAVDGLVDVTEVEVAGEAGIFVGPEIEADLYSSAGPYGRVGVQGKFEATIDSSGDPACDLTFGGIAQVGVKPGEGFKQFTGVDFDAKAATEFLSHTNNVCPADSGGGGSGPLAMVNTSLGDASSGFTYRDSLMADGGVPDYNWSATNLPNWLSLDSATGQLSGTAGLPGDYEILVTLTDQAGTVVSQSLTLTVIPATKAISVSAGGSHSCAVTEAATVRCWGYNAYGQLGDGTNSDRTTPVKVNGLSGVAAVSAGGMQTCALMEDHTVRCWGAGDGGALGYGGTQNQSTPVTVPGLTDVVQVDAGPQETCARTGAGDLWCWGFNFNGEVGNGTTETQFSPVKVDLADVTDVSVGEGHACALAGGSVWCWGANSNGVLGTGTTTPSLTPVEVVGLSGIVQVSAQGWKSCALDGDGTAYCWGPWYTGALGDNGVTGSLVPVEVYGPAFRELAAGGTHNCAVDNAGSAYCWGNNSMGALGDGTLTTRFVPVAVSDADEYSNVDVGGGFTCGATAAGAVKCWGGNTWGTLGLGYEDGSAVKVPSGVVGLS